MKAALALVACGGCGVLLSPNGPPTRAPLVATMEREGCFGECPIYKLEIFADGTVAYHGKTAVHTVGLRVGHMNEVAMRELHRQFAQVHFMSLPDFPRSDCTDLQQVTLEYQGHRVVHNWGDKQAPEDLIYLELGIDGLTDSVKWVGLEESTQQPWGSYCE